MAIKQPLSFIFISLLCVAGFSSCEFADTDPVTVPAYIYVSGYTFVTDTQQSPPEFEGDNSSFFTDVWLTANSNTIGGIGFPALIPVQASGPTQIGCEPGILISGQNDVRTAYPFGARSLHNVNLVPGEVDTIRPVFTYVKNAKFPFIEDFDRPGFGFQINPAYSTPGDTVLRVNDNRAKVPGRNSGLIKISDNAKSFLMNTITDIELRGGSSPVYLEIDYRTNVPLQIGYYYTEPGATSSSRNYSVIDLYAGTGAWKKLYLNMTEETAGKLPGTRYKFYVYVYKEAGAKAEVLIDNIKVVTL